MMVVLLAGRTAPRSSGATRPGSACSPAAARVAEISFRAKRSETILTVSRMEAEKGANPGYRAFLADGTNVTKALVLFIWEVLLEWTAAIRAARRDVRPRGHRGGYYPFLRGALCVIVRNAIVFGVMTDIMRGRPAVYATFSSYDEVAHHSGLERADTLEALRKLDQEFGRIEHAVRYAPRPYEIVVLSDHGQTQGATFKQRNGYGLDALVERALSEGDVAGFAGGDEQQAMVGNAAQGGHRHEAQEAPEERRIRPQGRGARIGQPRPDLPDGGEPSPHPRGDRRAPPPARLDAPGASARRLAARALRRARGAGSRRTGKPAARERARRGRGSTRSFLPQGRGASAAHPRVRTRGRPDGRELL